MKQNSALSWSFMLMATCLFGVGLGFSVARAMYAPRTSANVPPTEQAANPPAETSAPPPAANTESKPVPPAAASNATPAKSSPAPAVLPAASKDGGYWAARHLFITLNGQWLADGAKDLLKELRPGGVLLQDVNLGSRTQTFALVKEIKAAVGLGEGLGDLPLIAVQQEVGPYNLLGLENAPSAQALGQNGDPELARKLGQEYGAACVGRGIAIAFAPVLDVFEPGAINPGFAVRSFGTEHTLVARVGLAMADGLRQGGVLPVVKNFPGYGAATYGSDGLLVALNKDPAGLGRLLYPFDQAVRRGVPGMLVAHVAVPALDPENPRRPAALSPVLLNELLRTRWGYDGVIVADDVALNPMTRSMGAEEATVQALAAGCDAVIMLDPDPAKIRAVSAAIAAAVEKGTLSRDKLQQSAARLSRWQEAIGNLNPIRAIPEVERVAEALPPPASAAPEIAAPPPMENVASTQMQTTLPPAVSSTIETSSAPAPEVSPPANTPVPNRPEPVVSAPSAAASESTQGRIEHTVGQGETLADIARAYEVSVDNLKQWNALPSDQVAAGAKLTVYLGDASAPAAPTAAAPAQTEVAKATEPTAKPNEQPAPTPTPDDKPSEQAPAIVAKTEESVPAEEKPAPADTPADSPTEEPAESAGSAKAVYTVITGDTLSTIAEKFHVAAADIKLWNGLATDTISTGAILTIFLGEGAPSPSPSEAGPENEKPEEPEQTAAPAANAVEAPPLDIETEEYVVQPGDTLSKIARRHHTTPEILLTLNGLANGNQIFAGAKLKVPKAAAPTP